MKYNIKRDKLYPSCPSAFHLMWLIFVVLRSEHTSAYYASVGHFHILFWLQKSSLPAIYLSRKYERVYLSLPQADVGTGTWKMEWIEMKWSRMEFTHFPHLKVESGLENID